jgi:hypothetical protein
VGHSSRKRTGHSSRIARQIPAGVAVASTAARNPRAVAESLGKSQRKVPKSSRCITQKGRRDQGDNNYVHYVSSSSSFCSYPSSSSRSISSSRLSSSLRGQLSIAPRRTHLCQTREVLDPVAAYLGCPYPVGRFRSCASPTTRVAVDRGAGCTPTWRLVVQVADQKHSRSHPRRSDKLHRRTGRCHNTIPVE